MFSKVQSEHSINPVLWKKLYMTSLYMLYLCPLPCEVHLIHFSSWLRGTIGGCHRGMCGGNFGCWLHRKVGELGGQFSCLPGSRCLCLRLSDFAGTILCDSMFIGGERPAGLGLGGTPTRVWRGLRDGMLVICASEGVLLSWGDSARGHRKDFELGS